MVPSSGSRDTSKSLVAGLQSHDEKAWHRLVDLYGPLVYYWCRRAGLPAHDVPDLAQEVFRSVAGAIASFHHAQPGDTFRGWLRTITENKLRDHARSRRRRAEAAGGTSAQQMLLQWPGVESADAVDDQPAVRGVLQQALDLIRGDFNAQTWQAFCLAVLQGRDSAQVAAELGITANAVRKAKARVLHRLREELGDLPE
jgi:RNA polymerase sigma-70 factor (ECF subfamily)